MMASKMITKLPSWGTREFQVFERFTHFGSNKHAKQKRVTIASWTGTAIFAIRFANHHVFERLPSPHSSSSESLLELISSLDERDLMEVTADERFCDGELGDFRFVRFGGDRFDLPLIVIIGIWTLICDCAFDNWGTSIPCCCKSCADVRSINSRHVFCKSLRSFSAASILCVIVLRTSLLGERALSNCFAIFFKAFNRRSLSESSEKPLSDMPESLREPFDEAMNWRAASGRKMRSSLLGYTTRVE